MRTTSGREALGELDRLLPVGGGAEHLDIVEQVEDQLEALADNALIVGEDHADRATGHPGAHAGAASGSHRATRKPSAVVPASSRPPSSSARSRMPLTP